METADELIKTIKIDEANFEYCAKHKVINGTLLVEIKRVMNKFASQNPERVKITNELIEHKANNISFGSGKYGL